MSDGDWRLLGKQHEAWQWLYGAIVRRTVYLESREQTDHQHCTFCWAKFMEHDYPGYSDLLHVGYTTDDGPCWICETCFRDLVDHFGWLVAESPDSLPPVAGPIA